MILITGAFLIRTIFMIMNLRRIIREEMNDMDWIEDIKSNQDIAQEIADETKIKYNRIYSPFLSPFSFSLSFFRFFSPFSSTFFSYCKEQYGLSEDDINDVWDRYKKIIKDRVGVEEVETSPINESDDMQWIRDIPNELSKEEKWVIINDINPNSLEESKLIQNYLFKQGFKWVTGRNYYLPQKIYLILANPTAGISQRNRLGTFIYYSGEKNPTQIEKADEVIEEFKSEGKRVYYWSDIKPNVIMESDDMDWISDVKSNQDIAQEIADESEIKINGYIYKPGEEYLHSRRYSGKLYNPHFDDLRDSYTFYFQPFRFTDLLPIFLNYCEEQYGLTNKESQDVWERFKNIIQDKIDQLAETPKEDLNESDDMQWIKDIPAGIEIGACYKYLNATTQTDHIWYNQPLVIEKITAHVPSSGHEHPKYYYDKEVSSIEELTTADYEKTWVYLRNQETGYRNFLGMNEMVNKLEDGVLIPC